MDALLDARFQRVESALNTVIDSIASYNPSQSAVLDLVAADEDLSRRLEQLAIHQANYRRILSLRQAADTLDAQIKSTVGTLAETRKELVALPITTASPSARHVSTHDLLSYAKHIGKFTAPPGTKPPPSLDQIPRPEEKPDTGVNMANGASTDPQPPPQGGPADPESKTMAALSQEQKAWLAGLSNLHFVPWPTDDKIKLGALGQIQTMVEQGKDPATVLSIEEQEERAKRAAEEEEERRKEEEKRKAEAEQRRRESQPAAPNRGEAQGEQPAVFGGLDLY